MSIHNNILQIKQTIAPLSEGVTLIAVSKQQESSKILEAINAGQRVFGENRIQEAKQKWPGIKENYPDIELHLIGPLQTNKVSDAVKLFDVIETLDRPKLAECLLKEMQKQGRDIPCLIQVNIGKEPQKSGIFPEQTGDFINYCIAIGLNITGLMCIPPEKENPVPYFQEMRELATRHKLKNLSMGMSSDYKIAANCGATHIRVGTGIFGHR